MKKILLMLVCTYFFVGCKKDNDVDLDELKASIVENYADIVYHSYADALERAEILQTKITNFTTNPNSTTLAEAKTAWLASREPYGQTEVYRFYGGIIEEYEGYINSWPLDEAFIDYVEGDEHAGIINDTANFPVISKEVLLTENQATSEESVSVGYHAIEFLLWGQDLSAATAGNRPISDYTGTSIFTERRKQYLQICADILVGYLEILKDEWDPSKKDNYRTIFLSYNKDEAIRKMMVGMGILSKNELAGERMYVAYENMDQEDEHSCFSDNTHRDIILNAKGIENIYKGTYTKINGTVISGASLSDLFKQIDESLDQAFLTTLNESTVKTQAIYTPFDQAIVLTSERPKVLNAVTHLQNQGDKIVALAAALGLTITL